MDKKLYRNTTVLLLLILLLGLLLRFWNTPARYGFDRDPVRDAVVTKYALSTLSLPLTGPQSAIAPFSFGPWYYYQLIAAEALIPGPYAPWIYLGITSLLTILIMYKVGKELKDKTLGLILAFLTALTPSLVGPTAGLSNPNFIPLFASAMLLITVIYMKGKAKPWHIFLWGLCFGLGISHHYQMVVLLPLPFVSLLFYRKKLFSTVCLFALGVGIVALPSVIFELQNNWHNVRGMIFYATQGRNNVYIPNNWRIYSLDFWLPYFSYVLGVPSMLTIGVGAVLILINLIALIKRRLNPIYIAIMAVLVFDIIFLRYFSSQREYYYFLFTIPFLIIFVGYSLSLILHVKYGKYIVILVIILLTPFLLKQDISRLHASEDAKEYNALATFLKYKYPNEKFIFYECNERRTDMVYAINFLMLNEGLLDKNGRKIGFASEGCPQMKTKKALSVAKPLYEKRAYDLTALSSEELLKNGWTQVTPESIYKVTVTISNE